MSAFLFDDCNEAVSLRTHGFKVAVGGRIIPQSLTQSGHCLGKCRFADYRVTPHGVHQFLASHESFVVFNQVDEELEHHRVEVNLLPGPGKPPCLGIDHEAIETVHS